VRHGHAATFLALPPPLGPSIQSSLLTEETKERDVDATPGLGLGLSLGTVAALGLLLAALAVRRRNSPASSTRDLAVAA
jgi:hypothetical protein